MVKRTLATLIVTSAMVFFSVSAAQADTTINGPIDLGTATSFGILAGATVTNTGPSNISGDLGLSPGTSVTGGPNVTGASEVDNDVALQAQQDLTTAFGVAASLTPTTSGLADLTGLTLVPGVYRGVDLSLTGDITLNGLSTDVWVFQADNSLIVSGTGRVLLGPSVSACNVFWKVGSSATLGGGSLFTGTVMADQSITAVTGASIEGRLLARIGQVSLDTNDVTVPTGCADASGTVLTSSPVVTSPSPSAGTLGVAYTHQVVASGSPAPSFAVTGGSLPAGLGLDGATGIISGTPTTVGTSSVTITATNGVTPDAVVTYSVVIAAEGLAVGGNQDMTPPALVALMLILGGVLVRVHRRRSLRTP